MGAEYASAIDMWVPDAWVWKGQLAIVPDPAIVIHKTASSGDAIAVANFFIGDTSTKKSSHFIVGRDGTVVQCVHLTDAAGANCCTEPGYDPFWNHYLAENGDNLNWSTFSIEHVDNDLNNATPCTQQQLDSSFALVQFLCHTYGITADKIHGHNSIDPKTRAHCPGNYPLDDLKNFIRTGGINKFMDKQFSDVWLSVPGAYMSGIALIVKQGFMLRKLSVCFQTSAEISTNDWAGNPVLLQYLSNGLHVEYANGHGTIFDAFNNVVFQGRLQ